VRVRPAVESDLPAIVEHGRLFFEALPYRELLTFCPESFGQTMAQAIESEVVRVVERDGRLIASGGMSFAPSYHNAAEMIGQELYWFVLPGERDGAGQALLAALVTAAEERGARLIFLAATTGLRDQALARLYRARGYREIHRVFMKRV
jgi:GNAT superfamily N-acetyltransferase